MNILKFLTGLRERGVQLWLDGDKLCCKAPPGVLNAEIRKQMANFKPEIVQYLIDAKANLGTVPRLMAYLRSQGVKLWLEGGDRLNCKAPAGSLSTDIKNQMRDLKPEIIQFLRQANSSFDRKETENEAKLTLGPSARRIWFLEQLGISEPVLHLPFAFSWQGPLKLEELQAAVSDLVNCHLSLRQRIYIENGRPRLEIADNTNNNIQKICIDNSSGEIEEFIDHQIKIFTEKSFSWIEDPAFG